MDTINVLKEELLAKLKANRAEHRDIFEEALSGYRQKAIELLEDHIARIRANAPERVIISLPFPEDHTDEYDVAIAMLEMTVDTQIELDQREFRQYVLDDWAWTKQFLTSNSTYSGKALSKTRSA